MTFVNQDTPAKSTLTTSWDSSSEALWVYSNPITCSEGEHWFQHDSLVCACRSKGRFLPFDKSMVIEFNRLLAMGRE